MTLSIITVCYNNLEGLQRTFKTLKEELDQFEWVIIDGGSIDNTVEFASKDLLPNNKNIKFLSEPDKGIYDAMNKGFTMASGKFLLFLNSGDTLECSIHDVLRIKDEFDDINVFGIRKIDKFNKVVKWSGLHDNPEILKRIPLPHQSIIIKREVFSDLGGYDLKYRLLADHNFFSMAYVKGYNFKFFKDKILATFFLDGMSSKLKNSLLILKELDKIQIKNFGARLPFIIRIRYRYKYILSLLPFSDRLMSFSRNLFFNKY